jgi:hypothetical protein
MTHQISETRSLSPELMQQRPAGGPQFALSRVEVFALSSVKLVRRRGPIPSRKPSPCRTNARGISLPFVHRRLRTRNLTRRVKFRGSRVSYSGPRPSLGRRPARNRRAAARVQGGM